jgi:predicted RNA polymerase sigma factor
VSIGRLFIEVSKYHLSGHPEIHLDRVVNDGHHVEVHGVIEHMLIHEKSILSEGIDLHGRVVCIHDQLKSTWDVRLVFSLDVFQEHFKL